MIQMDTPIYITFQSIKYVQTEDAVRRCSYKYRKIRRKTPVPVSFLIKLQACNFIKIETLTQVFPCKFCEISKNTFNYRTSLVAASI